MAANGGNHRCALILSPLRVGETRGGGGVGAITWTGGCRSYFLLLAGSFLWWPNVDS
jgi:hypothetical protein